MRCYFEETLLRSLLPPILATEFIFGFINNGLALWIFFFHVKPWKSSTVLLFNLAIADFLLVWALPFRAIYYKSNLQWTFGDTFCKMCQFMVSVNRNGSIFFILAVTVDRYMRVVHPHHPINYLSISIAMCGAIALWLVTISMNVHVFTIESMNSTHCQNFAIDTEPQRIVTWHKLEFLFSFFIPLFVILYCTIRITVHLRRRQLVRNEQIRRAMYFIMVVAVVYVTCFLPSNIIQLLLLIKTKEATKTFPESQVCQRLEDQFTAFNVTICLTYLNSVLDPIIYYFSSSAFKRVCRRAFCLPRSDTADTAGEKT